ncbi:MAG: hypothetical protein WBD48_16560 [Pseudolabrys sp.]|jgi:CheY-like chemotaxis protein
MSSSFTDDSRAPVAGKRVLVLDDEFLIGLDIQHVLESAGASVVYVSNSNDAVAAVEAGPPFDVAVLDVLLGRDHQSSLGVAEALVRCNTPFVFLTGLTGESTHTRQFPKAPVVIKPYEAKALIAALRTAMS